MINIHFYTVNCPTLTQFQWKLWMSINSVTINIFGVNDPPTVSREEFAFDSNLALGWCAGSIEAVHTCIIFSLTLGQFFGLISGRLVTLLNCHPVWGRRWEGRQGGEDLQRGGTGQDGGEGWPDRGGVPGRPLRHDRLHWASWRSGTARGMYKVSESESEQKSPR